MDSEADSPWVFALSSVLGLDGIENGIGLRHGIKNTTHGIFCVHTVFDVFGFKSPLTASFKQDFKRYHCVSLH